MAAAVAANFAFNCQRSKQVQGLFTAPVPLSRILLAPDTATLAIPEAAWLEMAITILLVSKQSSLKAGVDMPVGQSHLSVIAFCSGLLQNRILMPCAQIGRESHDRIPIHKKPNNTVQQEPFFCCSSAMSSFTSAHMHSASPFPFQNFLCRGYKKQTG